jgi:DNA-binding NtrC family response regulator
VEDEFFGHERGAYTDARARRAGRFEEADGGTLFLDEICELSPSAQSKLLRVLQEKEITRLGGRDAIPVDVRIICATNQDPWKRVQEGRLREDLYYRLNVFPIHIPPLRERQDDIPPLVDHFITRFNALLGTSIQAVTNRVMERLQIYDWPGNVRELENTLQHAMLMATGPYIKEEDLPPRVQGCPDEAVDMPPIPEGEDLMLDEILKSVERRAIQRVLSEENGNRTRTARRLGISRQTLLTKIEAYGLE